MEWLNRQASIDKASERERLSYLSEKDFFIELILPLEEVNHKCDDIRRKSLFGAINSLKSANLKNCFGLANFITKGV